MTQPSADRIGLYFHIHLVSDSTGETLVNVMKASITQFDNVIPIEHLYALVRSERQLDRVLNSVAEAPGMVIFTISDERVRRKLEQRCAELNMPCIAVLDPLLAALSRSLGVPLLLKTGAQHHLDADYYRRIDALNFAMAHDDGQQSEDLNAAEVVLVGVSRTSKTPTTIYLAHRGIRAANVPIVTGQELPTVFATLERPLIVGLTAAPDRLIQIRRNRLLSFNETRPSSYVDEQSVREEVIGARRLFIRKGWPVIDVTRRSVEETAAKIINLINDRSAETEE
jgi:regulator of PEP synthase PpsR (kinase-PPPase family)